MSQNQDVKAQSLQLQQQISKTETEISHAQLDIQQKSDKGHVLKKDIDAQTYELQKLREENLRNTIQISTLQDKLNRQERDCNLSKSVIEETQIDLGVLQDRAQLLGKFADMRELNLRRVKESINETK